MNGQLAVRSNFRLKGAARAVWDIDAPLGAPFPPEHGFDMAASTFRLTKKKAGWQVQSRSASRSDGRTPRTPLLKAGGRCLEAQASKLCCVLWFVVFWCAVL